MVMRAYDDVDELDRYVWAHTAELFTAFELSVQRAHMAELKADAAGGATARLLRARWGAGSDPEVAAALASGWPAFRTAARERVMREHAKAALVNRCPVCRCVVQSPLARQCLWCGHDWHLR